MKIYNAVMVNETGLTESDYDELKSILEQFSKVNWILLYKKSGTIMFETEGFRYFDRDVFQQFLEKHSEDEYLTLEVSNNSDFYVKYSITNGEIVDKDKNSMGIIM